MREREERNEKQYSSNSTIIQYQKFPTSLLIRAGDGGPAYPNAGTNRTDSGCVWVWVLCLKKIAKINYTPGMF